LTALCLLALSAGVLAYGVDAAEEPSRVIHVVYDDSGSMTWKTGTQQVGENDSWCQAKYAMEVFAAMLKANDNMKVYVMSDFSNGKAGSWKLDLHGADGAGANVASVHNMLTAPGNTPFNTVRRAMSDLEKAAGDEKWLVVLTDGAFDKPDTAEIVDAAFAKKSDAIKVIFLSMGAAGATVTANESNGIYFEKAGGSGEILSKVTDISSRIFQQNKLALTGTSFSFDVPMSELVVFAQGENVNIGNITNAAGKAFPPASTVEVKYSEKASSGNGFSGAEVDTNLHGRVATFRGDFDVGNYAAAITGADSIEVYYKPNVSIAAHLYDADTNKEVTDLGKLNAGEYKVDFGFLNPLTNTALPQSKLLGDVQYTATVENGGEITQVKQGDTVSLKEGTLKVDANALFLKYNTVSTGLEFTVFENREVTFVTLSEPAYEVAKDGIVNADEPIKVKMQADGRDLTEEEWKAAELPDLTYKTEAQGFAPLKVAKTADLGVYHIYPVLADMEDEKPAGGVYTSQGYDLNYAGKYNDGVWTGEAEGTVKIKDNRSFWDKHGGLIVKLIWLAALLAFLLGYVFKRRFSKKMVDRPRINGAAQKPGVSDLKNGKGKFDKDFLSRIIPYRAERGTLQFAPQGEAPKMELKAIKGKRMEVTNAQKIAGKGVVINGTKITDAKTKIPPLTTGSSLQVANDRFKYTCYLDQKVK
jgi:hypothetical protein